MSCNGDCNCKSESKIETVWVESEIGEQLMFAVPEESRNEPTINKIDEIKKEILKYFDDCIADNENILSTDVDYSSTFKWIMEADTDANIRAKEEVEKIFEKYR